MSWCSSEEVVLGRVSSGRTTPWRRVGVLTTVDGRASVRLAPAWRALAPALTSATAEVSAPALELGVGVGAEVRVFARLALTPSVVRAIEVAILRMDRSVEGGPAGVRSRWPHHVGG